MGARALAGTYAEGRSPKVFARMTPESVTALGACAKSLGMTPSALVREAVLERLRAEGALPESSESSSAARKS